MVGVIFDVAIVQKSFGSIADQMADQFQVILKVLDNKFPAIQHIIQSFFQSSSLLFCLRESDLVLHDLNGNISAIDCVQNLLSLVVTDDDMLRVFITLELCQGQLVKG